MKDPDGLLYTCDQGIEYSAVRSVDFSSPRLFNFISILHDGGVYCYTPYRSLVTLSSTHLSIGVPISPQRALYLTHKLFYKLSVTASPLV